MYRALLPSIVLLDSGVLLDIGLPDIDGFQVARDIRCIETSHPIRLVAISGWGDEVSRARAFEAGFEHYLSKPVQLERLGELVKVQNSDV